uniref:Trypanosoma vivax n=1 Tax=Trypanosoma vivax (strain Y486) TaxID=1055687 RepID=G0U5H8_TRYVY|nr:Trypanosoma vivax [Trypanosoma vivax Y486]
MVLDSAAEENRRHCNQGDRAARSEAGRETDGSSGRSSAQLRQASGSAGKRSASTKTAEGVRKRHCYHKSAEPRSVPRGFGVASGPCRQGNVGGTSVGTKNVHNETPRRIRKSARPVNVWRARASFHFEFEAGEKQRRAVQKEAAVADGGREGAGSDVAFGPSEGSGGKPRKAGAANDAAGTGPRLQRDGVREGPRSNATRVGHGGLLGRNRVAAEEKRYQAPERPQRSHCRLGRSSKNTRGRRAQSGTLRGDRDRGCRRDGKTYCKNGGL